MRYRRLRGGKDRHTENRTHVGEAHKIFHRRSPCSGLARLVRSAAPKRAVTG
jgi:hypothetical protein